MFRVAPVITARVLAVCLISTVLCPRPGQSPSNPAESNPAQQRALVEKFCVTFHNDQDLSGGVSFQAANLNDIPKNAEIWEKAIRKLRVGAMPPQGMPRPD